MKNIAITEEAYEALQAHKGPDESFTDVILRLSTSEEDVMGGFGALSELDGFEEAVTERHH